jgi:hypothetical protein
MYKSIACSLRVLAACVALAGTADATYVLRSEQAGFTIEFPTEPNFEDKSDRGAAYIWHQWNFDQKDGAWSAAYIDFVGRGSGGITQDQLYEGSINAFANSAKGKLIHQQPIQHQGREGREALIMLPAVDGMMRHRFFIHGTRVYAFGYTGKQGTEQSPEVDAFLDSFRFSQ